MGGTKKKNIKREYAVRRVYHSLEFKQPLIKGKLFQLNPVTGTYEPVQEAPKKISKILP